MKSTILLSLVSLLLIINGCDNNCGLFGATTTYDTKLVVDREFEPIEVSQGDTLIFRPETFLHINYYYTGSSSCDGEDYKDAPRFYPEVKDDSLAFADAYYDESSSIWRGSEMKIRIIGKQIGSTILDLRTEWHEETKTEDFIREKSFEIMLEVIE